MLGSESFGTLVHKRRVAKGLTLEALAKKLGTHKGYISGIENGKVNPPTAKLTYKLAKALGLNPETMVVRGVRDKAPLAMRLYVLKMEDLLEELYKYEAGRNMNAATLAGDDAAILEKSAWKRIEERLLDLKGYYMEPFTAKKAPQPAVAAAV